MKSDDAANRPTQPDPYATRAPTPESIEEEVLARKMAGGESSSGRGVGRQEFDRGLIDCGFLSEEGLRAIVAALESDQRPVDPESLARHLVQIGKLTRYQASALYQGKGRSLQIGPYVVLDKLGSGGMGMVFKARLRKGGPEVALKLLPPSASKHPRAVLRFRREAEIMEKLNHPNVVSSHDIGQYNGVHYLVMDYVEGRDLDKVVRSAGPMKLPRAVDCIIQAAQGLAAAHERGIVHRDIKPANLLLDTKGVVRVLDLGLARITQEYESVKDITSSPSLTASGIIMGTVDYLPPEQSDDSKRVDHRADIYALGCTLYYLLTARPPFTGDSIMQRLLAHHQKPIPSLRAARPEVPIEVELIYKSMMAKSPDDRPKTIAEVADALQTWRNRAGAGKSLRVFDDGGASKSVGSDASPKPEGLDRSRPDELETYDLMTFVRDQIFEPTAETIADPMPIPSRRPRRAKKGGFALDLIVKGLVGAAALAVLLRFFPKDLFRAEKKPEPAAKVEPAPVVPPQAEIAPPVMVKVPELAPRVEPKKIETPKAAEPPAQAPPPGPSLLEELMRPPPPPPLGSPGSPGPGPPATKKGQAPGRGTSPR